MRPAAALWSLFAAACATSPPAVLEPFLAAGRFVPPGMTSFACERGGHLLLDLEPKLVVTAGRDFRKPEDPGIGVSHTIWIADLGEAAGADAALQRSLRDREVASVAVNGTSCLRVANRQHEPELWCATIDDRFVLLTEQRDVLAAALVQGTDLPTELAPFGDLSSLPGSATDIMLLLPREPKHVAFGMESPDGPTVCAVLPDPWRLVLLSRLPLPQAYSDGLTQLCSSVTQPVRDEAGWWVRSGVMHEQGPIGASGTLVSWLFLFGHCIFI